jgi:hypothetical protein
MMPLQFGARLLLCLTITAVCALPVMAEISGTLKVEGKANAVRFACGYEEEDPFEKGKTRIVVLLSTRTEDIRGVNCRIAENMTREKTQEDGEKAAPYLSAKLSKDDMQWANGALVVRGQYYSFSLSGTSVDTRSELSVGPAGATLNGRLFTAKPIRITSDFPAVELDVQLKDIPLDKLAPKSDELTGDAARRHPAAVAAQKMLGIMAQGNVTALRPLMVEAERPMFDKIMASPDKDKFVEMSKMMAADALKATNLKVSSRGAIHQVTFEKKTSESGSESMSFYLVQEGGEWRMTQQR